MSKVKVSCIPVGLLSVNCYFVWSTATNEGYIIDPGDEPDKILEQYKKAGFVAKGIMLTHAHVDHIRGVGKVAQELQVPVFLHADDKPMYISRDNALLPYLPAAENLPQISEDLPGADGINMQVVHTPGHTRGSACYYFPDDGFVMTGDTLFKGAVGRTDLPGGDEDDLIKSVRFSLLIMPLKTVVYPGHHASTTIADEQNVVRR